MIDGLWERVQGEGKMVVPSNEVQTFVERLWRKQIFPVSLCLVREA